MRFRAFSYRTTRGTFAGSSLTARLCISASCSVTPSLTKNPLHILTPAIAESSGRLHLPLQPYTADGDCVIFPIL